METSNGRRGILQRVTDWRALIRETAFSIPRLAQTCGVSVRQLQRHIKTTFGKRLGILIGETRLGDAHESLGHGESVKSVAISLGYKHVSHFCRSFRRHYGYCASEIRFHLHPLAARNQLDDKQMEFVLAPKSPRRGRPPQKSLRRNAKKTI